MYDTSTLIRSSQADQATLIRGQLARILASPEFVHSARMCEFLRFVVEISISGKGTLKETVIGVEVFGRAPGYDPSLEPIVRIEARRLRNKLAQYYQCKGAEDSVVIGLPKGGYTPAFEIRAAVPPESLAEIGDPGREPGVAPRPIANPPRRLFRASGLAAILLGLAVLLVWNGHKIVRSASIPRSELWAGISPADIPIGRLSRPIASIAILPLANLSGDPGQDYLADGMTDELITRLANIASLRVISRTSAMRYKGTHKALPEIAKELGVDAIVEGSVTRSGRRIRVTARLIDGKAGRYLWAQDYERPIGGILAVENDVARTIASQVRLTLSSREQSQLHAQADIAPEAYDAYLKGRYFWNKRTADGLSKSIGYFKQVVAENPGYAPAWAGLADSYLLLGEFRLRPRQEAFSKAEQAVDKALELDDELGEAHASRAALENDQGHWKEAEAEFRRALQFSPGYATAHQWYAEGLVAHGRPGEALAEIRRAADLDPLSLTVNVQVGYILFMARRYDEAIAQLRKAIEMDPYFYLAHADLGAAYEQKGMYPEAIAELQKSGDLTNDSPGQMLWLAHAWALAGRKAEARRIRANLEKPLQQGYISPVTMALLDLALGERDRALARLETACSAHALESLSPTPLFDPLRADPRITAVLAGCGKADKIQQTPIPIAARSREAEWQAVRRPSNHLTSTPTSSAALKR